MSADEIIELVVLHFSITLEEIKSPSQIRIYAEPRHAAMLLCHAYTGLSLKKIAAAFNRINHTTVIHAIRHALDLIDTDKHYKALYEKVDEIISERMNLTINQF